MVVLCSLLGSPVNSAIIYRNTETVLHANNDTWDIDADGTSETLLTGNSGDRRFLQTNIDWIVSNLVDNHLPLQALTTGFEVQNMLTSFSWETSIQSFFSNAGTSQEDSGGLTNNISSYIGFRFDGDRATSGRQNLFGWARVTSGTSTLFTIHEWAYEDVLEEAIAVGIVPEPTSASLGLLALGAAGLRRWRKETA